MDFFLWQKKNTEINRTKMNLTDYFLKMLEKY